MSAHGYEGPGFARFGHVVVFPHRGTVVIGLSAGGKRSSDPGDTGAVEGSKELTREEAVQLVAFLSAECDVTEDQLKEARVAFGFDRDLVGAPRAR